MLVAAANDPKRTFRKRLFDHLVGADKEGAGNSQPERFRRFEID